MEEGKKSKGWGVYLMYLFILVVTIGLIVVIFFISKDMVTLMLMAKKAFYKVLP